MKSTIELVVARYREDLRWLRRVPGNVCVTVYDKGGDASGALPLPNAGREAHTYLHHIVERYDDLAETTVFCQGKPFDHVPGFHKDLRTLAGEEAPVPGFRWLGFIIDREDPAGGLFRVWGKNEDGRGLDLDGFFRALWEMPLPPEMLFYPGAHFAVSRSQVRSQPLAWYRKALEVSQTFPDAAHCFERTWDRTFQTNGIPAGYRNGPFPVYLRPIRRLGLTWASVGGTRELQEES
jgi:hypothetical protein